ncbi:uncharacterized protein LOC129613999 [Condylostylus longicornis]|uniref:uncharacterized protein LOC129613999 n=1 Tax=Condylostylus longicornis TaxID=2530218 RepID=UPI00244DEE4C|nr:uncharacterized protein LOC129613999 [Condylostylus longicornis]
MSNRNFLIRSATRFDYGLIRYGLKNYFWTSEPLSTGWKDQKVPSLLEFRWTMTNVMNGLNTISFDPNHYYNFIGFTVNNRWSRKDTMETLKLAKESNDQRLFAIIGLQKLAEDETDLYNKYNVNEIFSLGNIGVHPEYFGKSLGYQMVLYSLNRAKRIGFELAMVNATNDYGKRICEKAEMEEIAKIQYSSIIDEDSEDKKKIFNSSLDDKKVSVFIKKFK